MKAALLKAYGDVDQFEISDIPIPQPGPGEVLLRIEASAINPFDLILRQGVMAQHIPLPLPAVLGGDAAGTIAALGPHITGFSIGERVVADFAATGRGAHAEYGVVPETSIARLPSNLSFEQGAVLVKAGLTGRQTVVALGIAPGDRVLVSGGLGAVGRAAIQYLRQIGARPVAGVRAERLVDARTIAGEALDIGAAVIEPDFDFAISTAAPVASQLLARVRDGGKVVSIVPLPEGREHAARLTIHELYHRTDAKTLDAVLKAASEGVLTIPIAQILALDEIGPGHEAVAAGTPGKIVLKH